MSNTTDRRIIGDTLHTVNAICYLRGEPYDWEGKTPSVILEEDDGTAIAEAGTVTAHVTQTVTLDSTNNWIHCERHGIKVGNQVRFATSGSLGSTGLTASTTYIVVESDPLWFKVSLSAGGQAITIAGAGTGTHTVYVVGSIQYEYHADEVDTASPLRLWFRSTSATKTVTFPSTSQGATVEIEALGNG